MNNKREEQKSIRGWGIFGLIVSFGFAYIASVTDLTGIRVWCSIMSVIIAIFGFAGIAFSFSD